jgi:hypothetical protein
MRPLFPPPGKCHCYGPRNGAFVETHSDYKDLLRLLSEQGVRYIVVGGYAAMKYTEPFWTKDLDLWVKPTLDNATRSQVNLFRPTFTAPCSGSTTPKERRQNQS